LDGAQGIKNATLLPFLDSFSSLLFVLQLSVPNQDFCAEGAWRESGRMSYGDRLREGGFSKVFPAGFYRLFLPQLYAGSF